MVFSGESIVSDFDGNTLALACADEQLLIAEVELLKASEARIQKPYTSLRRLELYL